VHAINHTCHPDFENCKFVYVGITRDPRGVGLEDEGGVGGRRTSVVFVQTMRRVEREEEFFGPGATRTILLFRIISARPPKRFFFFTRPRPAYALKCRGY
jgi:hypothetical protein